MLAYSLFLDDALHWHALSVVFLARLTNREVLSIAFAALRALEPEAREMVFGAAHWGTLPAADRNPCDTPEFRQASAEYRHRFRMQELGRA
ncbi:MAG: hypothetical protein HLUCCA12_06500 [Rhodobacteraceae bacterium HLUCCA12]|nr:MAG: hypothetical protein HLUCCA12_06500 [Rhodobacteraceae bacterium HLUCCA12]